METITLNLYKFSELSEDAKKKAIEKHLYINVDHEWWDFIYYNAKKIGIKISAFDIYRKDIDVKFIEDAEDVANNIIKDYGKNHSMTKLSEKFIEDYTNLVTADEVSASDVEDIEEEFLKDIGEEYLSMLQQDYDYYTSDEAIAETLEANEYDFLETGKRY